ncbi:MAG: 1-(5-phosphoribosyl)-5-[(5-phosphoribosylamino)methylideneamino]imidazole-4-carboxamide isomerase [Eggerthellaceae bacterium]|nr:1-(5-phosphoribosyl)-5-[(5-phosphoribosylamino)methylideneamino]imidazole-4-carboxamide isomerase [Eggerthellaceae bacterium]
MLIFPAIDLYEGCVVRLYKGDYAQKTVYSQNPSDVAEEFKRCGATHIHMVDLEGARKGTTPNLGIVADIKNKTGLFVEVGGGIRSMEVVKTYIDAGIDRVILGTAAIEDKAFLRKALDCYKDKVAVGVDIKDGYVAIKGWVESSGIEAMSFCKDLESTGVATIICTDISKDGAMGGTNKELYKQLSSEVDLNIIASGGVSSLSDVEALKQMGLYGAIVGKAYYEHAIDLAQTIEVAS